MASQLRIALVHDYLKEYGGAELVLETLSDLFPQADIYTTLYHPASFGPHRQRLEKKWANRLHQSFFRLIPFAHKIISPLRLLSPLAFHSFDFSKYDLIITSATGAYFPNSLNKRHARLLCYCHTPPRYLYGLPTARQLTNNPLLRSLVALLNHFLRFYDFSYAQNVDQFIANSQTTASRIKKFYRLDSLIINPPVDTPKASNLSSRQAKSYYLTGGRLARAKRYDVAIQACNQLKLPLKVFGRDFAGFEQELKNLAGPTIEFLGEVTQSQKARLFRQAKAFIFCSDNEDFGIIPVESMAYGCPVIAYRSGGATETILNRKTGVFFDHLTPDSCASAIQEFRHLSLSSQSCRRQSQKFSASVFNQKFLKLVGLINSL
jgi:glycosyltransferase involved in cell wall biosynthesis